MQAVKSAKAGIHVNASRSSSFNYLCIRQSVSQQTVTCTSAGRIPTATPPSLRHLTLAGETSVQLHKLPSVCDYAAVGLRLVCSVRKLEHITPLFRDVQW